MKTTFTDRRQSAFTLIELLVVIGLMAVLATVSVAGYSAANRGMADRGAIQSTVSTLRVAQQTCMIDRVPTKVLFFNQLLSSGGDANSATLYQGTAIAIKQAGRITMDPGKGVGMLVDEFADWNQSFPTSGSSGLSGMRLFRMTKSDESKDIEGCSTIVNPFVTEKKILDDYMIQSGISIRDWCERHAPGNAVMWGFEAVSGSAGNWKAGDPYGVEIARIDLPRGYIFGSSPPTGNKLKAASVAAVTFDPEDGEPSMSASVPISLMRAAVGGTFSAKPVGTITANMLKDTFK